MENIALLKEIWFKKEVERLGRKGVSKADISRSLDIKPQYLNSVLNGSRGLADSFLDKFIEVFGINQFDLLPPPKEDNMVDSSIAMHFLDKIDKKDAENKALNLELRTMTEELATLKEQLRQLESSSIRESNHPPLIEKVVDAFTPDSLGGSGKDFMRTRNPVPSKTSSASKT